MKRTNQNIDYVVLWLKAGLVLLVAALLFIFFAGCRVNKNSKTTTATSSEMTSSYRDSVRTVDSIAIAKRLEEKYKELTSDISFYKNNEDALIQALNELQDTITSRGFMSESLQARMKRVLDSLKANPCKNEVTINRDGSVSFKGQIKDLKLRISEMQRIMDSSAIARKETERISEGETTKNEETKTEVVKSVKRGLPGFVLAIIWFVVGYIVCWVMPPKRIVALIRKVTIRI